MRVFLALGLLAVVSLSGCASGGSALNAYLVQPGDLPAECTYMPLDDPGLEFLVDEYNLTSNPGTVDNQFWTWNFGDEGSEVIANRLAAFDCSAGDDLDHVYSVAMQFSDANATARYDDDDDCDYISEEGEFVLVNGPILAFVELKGEASGMLAPGLMDRLAMRMGIPNPCA